jgi:hypothetical protein
MQIISLTVFAVDYSKTKLKPKNIIPSEPKVTPFTWRFYGPTKVCFFLFFKLEEEGCVLPCYIINEKLWQN